MGEDRMAEPVTSGLLFRGTMQRPIGTKHATIPFKGLQQSIAVLAMIIDDSRIRGHQFTFPMTAFRAGDRRIEFHCLHRNLTTFIPSLTNIIANSPITGKNRFDIILYIDHGCFTR